MKFVYRAFLLFVVYEFFRYIFLDCLIFKPLKRRFSVYRAGGWRGHSKYGILHMNEKETNQRLMDAGLSHSSFNEGLPSIVTCIIYINILVFGAWMWASKTRKWAHFMMDHWTVSALGIIEKHRAHTLFTSAFSHKSFFHLLVNCATLNCFCSKAALLLGTRNFLALYMVGGIMSSLCWVVWSLVASRLNIPASSRVTKNTPYLGASGSISAVVAWFILTFPARIVYFQMVVPLPAASWGLLYLAKDFLAMYRGSYEGGACHLGGAFVGAAFFLAWQNTIPRE